MTSEPLEGLWGNLLLWEDMKDPAFFKEKADTYISAIMAQTKPGYPCQVSIYSDAHDIALSRSNMHEEEPFHGASIGKMFTAVIIGMLQDKGLLRIDDTIQNYIPAELLNDLFIYKGTDYRDSITIRHLLGHTSGIADYFESKTLSGDSFVTEALHDPDKQWTPLELLEFTRTRQKAEGAPGSFHYSDTGYVLLGMIIERVYNAPFHDALREFVFEPLGMQCSYFMFFEKPRGNVGEIAPVYFNGRKISGTNILTCDWAGGGIVSTATDLVKFQRAYWQGKLINRGYMQEMQAAGHKYHAGIHYGMGMMRLHLNEFFFLLPKSPQPYGHSGIVATQMFYDPTHDLHIIINLGSNKLIPKSLRALIAIEQLAIKHLPPKA